MKQRIYALCDANSFYVSAEQLFNPKFRNRAVVVASNNDGCAVARSPQAKRLGIRMGEPLFKIQPLLNKHDVVVCSSNYALYADMSARFMTVLEALAPQVLPYSIDEAFLDLTGLESALSYETFGHQVKDRVLQWTGLPICVGISTSLTLAKLANHAAKRYPKTGGVVDLTCPERRRRLLALTPVEDVWGVGSRLTRRLQAMGIETALQLAEADPASIRERFSVVLERTVRDLRGEACHSIDAVPPPKQEIVCSKSFGQPVTQRQDMLSACAAYTVRAAEKLRGEGREAGRITLFMMTSPFRPGRRYSNSATRSLIAPTADTRTLLSTARQLAESIWRDGYHYSKAGVMLSEFREPGQEQGDLFEADVGKSRSQSLMAAVDHINQSGVGHIRFARQTINPASWSMRRAMLSPAYTTRWSDLPVAK